MMTQKELTAKRLKSRRIELKLTQDDLAKKIGTTYQTISKYERAVNGIDSETLTKLSKVLDCTTDYLLCRTDEPNSTLYSKNIDNKTYVIESQYPYGLTNEEVETVFKYLESTNYDVPKLIKRIKNGEIKFWEILNLI